jgi:uncharacterized delta-60 repeat protein
MILVLGDRQALPRLAVALILFSVLFVPTRARAADGSLETSFGNGGKVITDFFGLWDEVRDVAIQSDGKIVAAGFTQTLSTGDDFAVARFNANGELDPTFGAGGKVTIDFFGGDDQAYALAIQPDGRIILAGYAGKILSYTTFALARLNTDGRLDETFGNNGKVSSGISGIYLQARDVALQSDGSIVVGGVYFVGPLSFSFVLTRYLTSGSPDTTFGTSGWVTTNFHKPKDDFEPDDQLSAIAIQSDGKIVAAGHTRARRSNSTFAVARYLPGGTLDESFASGGKITIPFFTGSDVARDVAIQTDGKILVAGAIFNSVSQRPEFGVARINSDGTLDAAFGNAGKVTDGVNAFSAAAATLLVQPDKKIVVAGGAEFKRRTDGYADTAFAVVRFDKDGNLDKTFGLEGRRTDDFGELSDDASAVAIQPDGRLVVAGGSASFQTRVDFAVVCYQNTIRFPQIEFASVSGKKLFVDGQNFDDQAVILINGEKQKTSNDQTSPTTRLIGKKAGKKIRTGDKIKVRNSDGTESKEFVYP